MHAREWLGYLEPSLGRPSSTVVLRTVSATSHKAALPSRAQQLKTRVRRAATLGLSRGCSLLAVWSWAGPVTSSPSPRLRVHGHGDAADGAGRGVGPVLAKLC